MQRNPTIAAVMTLSLALIAAVGVIVWKSDLFHRPAATGIAVLPFENLSNDKEDASFADGVQDDILTKLAKIADSQGHQPHQRDGISRQAEHAPDRR